MADEVNQAAFEGGDTEPATKAKIKERNEAMQEHVEELRSIGEKLDEAEQEAYDSSIKAEKAVGESMNALVTGEPVVTPPDEG